MNNSENTHNLSPETIKEWLRDSEGPLEGVLRLDLNSVINLATKAAQWGADRELEACCEWLEDWELCDPDTYKMLREARRPKPKSLKQKALEKLAQLEDGAIAIGQRANTIRLALEQLPDE